jgi:hypothetical protein
MHAAAACPPFPRSLADTTKHNSAFSVAALSPPALESMRQRYATTSRSLLKDAKRALRHVAKTRRYWEAKPHRRLCHLFFSN